MKKPKSHWLVTLPVGPGYVHSYLISADPTDLLRVSNKMFDDAEKVSEMGGFRILPLMLQTKLDSDPDAIERIETFLSEMHPEFRKLLKKVKDFHLTMWVQDHPDPSLKWLMELH